MRSKSVWCIILYVVAAACHCFYIVLRTLIAPPPPPQLPSPQTGVLSHLHWCTTFSGLLILISCVLSGVMTHHEGEEEKDVYNILGFIAAELAVVPESLMAIMLMTVYGSPCGRPTLVLVVTVVVFLILPSSFKIVIFIVTSFERKSWLGFSITLVNLVLSGSLLLGFFCSTVVLLRNQEDNGSRTGPGPEPGTGSRSGSGSEPRWDNAFTLSFIGFFSSAISLVMMVFFIVYTSRSEEFDIVDIMLQSGIIVWMTVPCILVIMFWRYRARFPEKKRRAGITLMRFETDSSI